MAKTAAGHNMAITFESQKPSRDTADVQEEEALRNDMSGGETGVRAYRRQDRSSVVTGQAVVMGRSQAVCGCQRSKDTRCEHLQATS